MCDITARFYLKSDFFLCAVLSLDMPLLWPAVENRVHSGVEGRAWRPATLSAELSCSRWRRGRGRRRGRRREAGSRRGRWRGRRRVFAGNRPRVELVVLLLLLQFGIELVWLGPKRAEPFSRPSRHPGRLVGRQPGRAVQGGGVRPSHQRGLAVGRRQQVYVSKWVDYHCRFGLRVYFLSHVAYHTCKKDILSLSTIISAKMYHFFEMRIFCQQFSS